MCDVRRADFKVRIGNERLKIGIHDLDNAIIIPFNITTFGSLFGI